MERVLLIEFNFFLFLQSVLAAVTNSRMGKPLLLWNGNGTYGVLNAGHVIRFCMESIWGSKF